MGRSLDAAVLLVDGQQSICHEKKWPTVSHANEKIDICSDVTWPLTNAVAIPLIGWFVNARSSQFINRWLCHRSRFFFFFSSIDAVRHPCDLIIGPFHSAPALGRTSPAIHCAKCLKIDTDLNVIFIKLFSAVCSLAVGESVTGPECPPPVNRKPQMPEIKVTYRRWVEFRIGSCKSTGLPDEEIIWK